ncbi:hypothetical protein AZI86_00500 [Bdellovibrio bacteriovorus]|uniref:Lipoprotein n=1 Tax=Bdellovibrio bacteriovorus TaxID=959 RepID=A0A150WM70_BDEBC|nr:DUF6279 family lipoprotein [Bdellovibrio bacteriovorus]KYG65593.1 hypothetical protein AZI86_00500 [Bdellovibrio bacteriovorus]
MKRIIFSLFAVFILSTTACSRGEFLFRFADDYAASKADRYFDLTSAQKKEFKIEIRKDIDTGKKEAFPKMANRLRQLEKDIKSDDVDPAVFTKAFNEIEKQVKGIGVYFQDTAIKTSLNLSQAQVEHFANEVREDIAKEEKDPAEATEKVEKRYRKNIEYFVGSVTREQNKMIQSFLDKNPYPWRLQNRSQEHVVKQFVVAAQSPDTRKAFVEKFAKDYESVRLPEYRKALSEHQAAFISFLTNDFWKSMSKEQKKTFKENLIARAEQLERIAKQ